MDKKNNRRAFIPSFIVFILVNLFCTTFANWLSDKGIDPIVLGTANLFLFALSVIIFFMYKKALQNTNPNVFVRSVMGGTLLKLVVIAGASVIYFLSAGKDKSLYAIVAAIALYFIYTFIEVKNAQKLNREHGSR